MLLLLPLILNIVGVLARGPALRIVGGRPVSITERPFQILIFRKVPVLVPGCGGSIIDRRWILTAAHCVVASPAEMMLIRAGSDSIEDDDDTRWYTVAKVISHEGFENAESEMTNDIALIMTDVDIVFSQKIQPIELSLTTPKPSDEVIISGFGANKEGDMVMNEGLKEVTVKVVNRKYCKELLEHITNSLALSDTHFCAAHLEGGQDACQGDSGGPVTMGDYLVGIVSWGIGCAETMVPAFYTDVAQFVPWIKANMGELLKRKNKCRPGSSI